MRKSDYLRKKRGNRSMYPIQKDKLQKVCNEWGKAGLVPDKWLDTHDDFYFGFPNDVLGSYFEENPIEECYTEIQHKWEEYANGGVNPKEGRWMNVIEIIELSRSLVNIIPFDKIEKVKVYFSKNKFSRFFFHNPRHPWVSAHKEYVYTSHEDKTIKIFAELCMQVHAFTIMNTVLDGITDEYIEERQGNVIKIVEKQEVKLTFKWGGWYPIRKINGLYICNRQWTPEPFLFIAILAIILIFGVVVGVLTAIGIGMSVIGLLLIILLFIFL